MLQSATSSVQEQGHFRRRTPASVSTCAENRRASCWEETCFEPRHPAKGSPDCVPHRTESPPSRKQLWTGVPKRPRSRDSMSSKYPSQATAQCVTLHHNVFALRARLQTRSTIAGQGLPQGLPVCHSSSDLQSQDEGVRPVSTQQNTIE